MKTFKFFGVLFFAVLSICFVACSSGNDGPEPAPTPTPQPTPTPTPTDKIDVTSKPTSAIQSNGGETTVEFTASSSWTASSSCDWITITPASGSAGTCKITIKVDDNKTYDERNGAITIKCGNTSQNITITQKQLDAIVLTSDKVEAKSDQREVSIEVKANVDYSYEIEESAKSWISVPQTRGLSASTILLVLEENDNLNGREGRISITSGTLSEVVTIYQVGVQPSIVISQKEYVVASAGEVIKVELQSNCDYEIQMPNVAWISKAETRSVSSYTHYFDVAENTGYDAREASIIFTNKDNGISETITVKQVQKDAIIISNDSYEVGYEANTLGFDVNSNVDFKVETSVDWIKQQAATRGLTTKPLNFFIAENTSGEKRDGNITISYNDLKQIVKVIQNRRSYLEIEQKGYEIAAKGGSLDIPLRTNSKYSVKVGSSWITDKGSSAGKHSFTVAENTSYDSRSATIQFVNEETKDVVEVNVQQKQQDAIVLNKTSYEVDYSSGQLNIEVNSNVEYQISSSVAWISQVPTRALNLSSPGFSIAENTSRSKRSGTITFSYNDIVKTVNVTQDGCPYLDVEKKSYEISSEGGNLSVSISSKGKWNATVLGDASSWCSVSPSGGNGGNGTMVLTVSKNDQTQERSATINITSGNLAETITVKQAAAPVVFIIENKNYIVEGNGENIVVKINTNVPFTTTITSGSDWINLVETRTVNNEMKTFVISENTTNADRVGRIVFETNIGGITEAVVVTQKKKPSIGIDDWGDGTNYKGEVN